MSKILNTYSSSFKYDLQENFSFNDEDIKIFLSTTLLGILNENDEIKEKINNYKELKQFLGKKRHKKINESELTQNMKHFKVSVSLEKVNDLLIEQDENENIRVEEKGINFSIYQKPMILIQLFDSQTINIDLINDNIYFRKKLKDLNNFRYKIYSVKNKDNELNLSNEFEIRKNKFNKSIEIENENICPYLLVMNSQIPEMTEDDLLYKNIYKTLEVKNGLISPENISKIFFYYFRVSKELQKTYSYIESKNRNELYSILSEFLNDSIKNIIIIVGPKGIGKTSTLIRFSYEKSYKILYFNLESFQLHSGDIKKKELKIQFAKLLGNINQKRNNK